MSPVIGHANTHGCSIVGGGFVCVCPGTISTTMPFGEQGPVGGNGHRPAHVQPGLTRVMDPAGRTEKKRRREERVRKKSGGTKERERKRWRVTSGPS